MPFRRVFWMAAAVAALSPLVRAEEVGIRAPEGFEVTLYAGDELAHDIFAMTIDSRGRVVVAGRGYVKILHDDDGDGRADRATLFSEFPKSGAHGMVFIGNDLIATGDNLLLKLEDKDGDGVADGKPIPLANVLSPEHGANGLAQGPDGWIYMICGNDAGVGSQLARTKTSPVKRPQAGALVRFSPDFKQSEVFADGFRNPYDVAFNPYGHVFTVEADGERDQHLPWYSPTRLFDIQQGMHHGWVQRGWMRSWNRPESFFDNVPRLVEIGRGSPTGVECYRHYAFPRHYRGGIFGCCWTLGTVYYFPLQRDRASYSSDKEIFLQTKGDVGFAPVALAVGPEGDMFVAIGGRGTRGSVFRVRYTGELNDDEQSPKLENDLERVLAAPQPLAAWSRAAWLPLAKKIGREELEKAALAHDAAPERRIRAIEVVTELWEGLSAETFNALAGREAFRPPAPEPEDDPEVVARAIWSASRSPRRAEFVRRFKAAAVRDNALVQRAAWEALAAVESPPFDPLAAARWRKAIHSERHVQAAALQVPHDRRANDVEFNLRQVDEPLARSAILHYRGMHGLLGPSDFEHAVWLFDAAQRQPEVFAAGEAALAQERAMRLRRSAVRMMQLCLGDVRVEPMRPDVYAGYTANAPGEVPKVLRAEAGDKLAGEFPTSDAELNREIARTVGMLEVAGPHERLLAEKLAACPDLNTAVTDDIHFLIVLSRIGGERSEAVTHKTAAALALLHYKMALGEMYPSRNWPHRVGETFVELCKRDPPLAAALAGHRDFGLPQHAMFAERMPEKDRKTAARKMLAKAQAADDEDFYWTAEMVRLIAELGDEEALAEVRRQWRDHALRDAIIAALHRDPQPADKKLYLDALAAPQAETVVRAAEALARLGAAESAEQIAAALSALQFYSGLKDQAATRKALTALLAAMTGAAPATEAAGDDPQEMFRAWYEWFAENHPQAAKRFNETGGDGAELLARLDEIDFSAGDAARGEQIYRRQSCVKCHTGSNRLGPGLEGVTGRWSREDLIRKIADPSRNVSPQYHTTRLITRDGKVYQGIQVYESPEATLLQTGPEETIRIAGTEVVSIAKSRTSLMPTGLLRGLSDGEVADLYAYLKTLTARRE